MTRVRVKIGATISSQAGFWADGSRLKAYLGGIGSGKTFAGAAEVLTQPPGSRGMVVAPTYRMMRDASQALFFDAFGALVREHRKAEQVSVLKNGTQILWRSADRPDSLRGPNLHWLWGDEWAFVDEAAHLVCVGRVRVSPARIWVTTTPNGLNWLYDVVTNPLLLWSLHQGRTLDNVHLGAEFLATIEAQFADDPLYAAQELEGAFVDLSGTKRHPALLVESVSEPRVPLSGPGEIVTVFEAWVRGEEYVIGADPAEGVDGGDDSAAVVLHRKTGRVVATVAGEHEPGEAFPTILDELSSAYGRAPVLVERNNHGHAVIAGVQRRRAPLLSGDDGGRGWRTTAQSKAELHRSLHSLCLDAFDAGRILIPSARLRDEVKAIDRTTLAHPAKKKGKTKLDDLATALALAAMARERQTGRGRAEVVEVAPVLSVLTGDDW